MAILRPFRGIMYDQRRVDLACVVAPPYDVISPKDQLRYYEQDPHNVVRLIAGEVRPTDSSEDNKYLRAAGYFAQWMAEGVLRQEPEPRMYFYRHDFVDPRSGEARRRHGILGVVELEPFGKTILPHERTHARAKADRLSLTRAVHANLSPIFSLYEDPNQNVSTIVQPALKEPPRLSIQSEDGDHHTVWSIADSKSFREIVRVLEASHLYVADGHHRYETALNFRDKMRLDHPEAPPDAAFNYVLMLLVDINDPGLSILPTHRFIHDLEAFDAASLLGKLASRYRVSPQKDQATLLRAMQEPVDTHRIGLATPSPLWGGSGRGLAYFTLDIPLRPSSDPVSELDVSVLHREIIHGVLMLPETVVEEERHVGYWRDLDGVLDRVATGAAQAAFLLRPPAVSDVVAVAAAGQVMPQKSTYFYPKPASGIVFNPLDPAIRIPAV